MTSSLPTRQDIRNRFIFMYGAYLAIIFIFWIYVDVSIVYVMPMVAVLCIIGFVNYRTNVRVLSRRPMVSSDDFREYRGIVTSSIGEDGLVRIRGETWKAKSDEPIDKGKEVEVIELLDNMTLLVQESKEPNSSSTEDLS